jgi:D-beta-D-heptose 7-phosphate kinase/D-beta-D-heptose 1-phosphate adenosyltransferase
VFANGCFRIPHTGHAQLCNWARQQGDVLVVGVNDDASVANLRPRQRCLPLDERATMLASLASVDWVVPFSEPDPCVIMRELKPDVLCKGAEYAGQQVPGSTLASEVRFMPEELCKRHATSLLGDSS